MTKSNSHQALTVINSASEGEEEEGVLSDVSWESDMRNGSKSSGKRRCADQNELLLSKERSCRRELKRKQDARK